MTATATTRPSLLPELMEALARRPFVPMRVHVENGAYFEVTRPGLAYVIGTQVLISRRGATGLVFDRVAVETANIARIEVGVEVG